MNIRHFLFRTPKSMLAQMVILTLLFLGVFIYFIAIRPLLDIPEAESDPIGATLNLVTVEINQFLNEVKNKPESSEDIRKYPTIKEALAKNPNFIYYLRQDGHVYSNTNASSYMSQLKLEQLHEILNLQRELEVCTNSSYATSLKDDGKQVSVMYSFCGNNNYYIEFSGIENPLEPQYYDLTDYYKRWFWSFSQTSLFAAGGVFLIAALILLFNMQALHRLASLANSFDPNDLDKLLPEKGLSKEVLPLVKAVNQMIAKVNDTQKKHKFFLSTAAHEMRTPLTILRTRLEELEKSEIKDELVDDVRRISGLVNELLRLMRVEGPQELKEIIDIVKCCKTVIMERAPYAIEQNCTLSLDTDVSSYFIKGDEDLMQVALANLIDNAISFSPKDGEINIAINGCGLVKVTDQGPGVNETLLDSLFEPFAKYPSNRNGHGLGLAIVKAIFQLHGASIYAVNLDEGGACFSIQFCTEDSAALNPNC